MKWWPFRSGDDPEQLARTLMSFVHAQSWDESQRIVEQHPELLGKEAEAVIEQIEAEQHDAEAIPVVQEHRELLCRCRDVGVARAFAEKRLSRQRIGPPGPDTGKTLDRKRAAEQMVPELSKVVAELTAMGIEIRTAQDLDQALAGRPDLRARLHQAMQPADDGLAMPSALADDLRTAEEEEQRYLATGDRTALDSAIASWLRMLDHAALHSAPLRFRLAALNDAGGLFMRRYWEEGRDDDLKSALKLSKQAVQATPSGSPDLPMYLSNLGNALATLSKRAGGAKHLDEAIQVYREAVQRTPPDVRELPIYLSNLGAALNTRFALTGHEEDSEEAIRLHQQAVQATPPDSPDLPMYLNNLGTGLSDRFRHTGQEADLDEAIQAFRMALQAAPPSSPDVPMYLTNFGNGLRDRARLLAEALQRRRRDLERLPARGHAELYRRYREIVQRQEQLTPDSARPHQPDFLSGQAQLDAIIAANVTFEMVVADIQKISGYADFLAEPTFSQIQAAAADTPLAYLLATSAGGLALLVNAHTVEPVWLDSLTDEAVRNWLWGPADKPAKSSWLGAYQNWLIEHTQHSRQAWFEAIDDVVHQLWNHIMQPLAEALHHLDRSSDSRVTPPVTLIPAGLLALLPLHAAWTEDASTATGRRYFLDEFTVNYAPSALALGHGRDRAERASADRLLSVEEPLATGASPLPNVHAEVTAIAGLFDKPVVLAREKATRQAVRAALPQADVVHFSCHGSNNWQSPLDSGLLMADDESSKNVMLTVRDFLESEQAGGRLATLSACETGIVGTELTDEVVGLPSALLQAGFGGVAASLWSVSDISTAMLMERFYAGWRQKGEYQLSPAEALCAAQRWLRDSTNKEKADYFKRYNKEISGMRMPETTAIDFFNQMMSRNLDSRDFAHPFWWAAFYLTGV